MRTLDMTRVRLHPSGLNVIPLLDRSINPDTAHGLTRALQVANECQRGINSY